MTLDEIQEEPWLGDQRAKVMSLFERCEAAEADLLRLQQNTTTLLYVLMRDNIPSGAVERLIDHAAIGRTSSAVYSAKHLEAYARELAQLLRDGKARGPG